MNRLLPRTGIFATVFALSLTLAQSTGAVTLIHTNDILGEIEPCGCRNNPQGGMVRKTNFMKRLPDQELIQVDAGDLLFATDKVAPLLASQAEAQAEYLLKSMDLVHHDVVVPGEKDFGLGYKTFERLRKKTKIKFLAANLRKKNGSAALDGSVILTRKGPDGKPFKVAIVGLVGEELKWPAELKAAPAIATAKKLVPALRKKADLVIAVTHQGYEKDQELAKAVPGIDLIVGGHTQSFLQQPPKVGDSLILQSSFRNQYVGALPLKKPLTTDGYQLIGLDAGYESPADAPTAMDDLVKTFKKSIAELNSKQDAMLEASAEPLGGSGKAGKFQTFPRCAECHLKQFDFWRRTPHARAFISLVEKQQAKNKECLSCHTVGLGDPQGFKDVNRLAEFKKEESAPTAFSEADLNAYLKAIHEAKSLKAPVKLTSAPDEAERPVRTSLNQLHKAWTPVQCENCHQPGGDHPFAGTYSKKVEKNACLSCHTPERAPGWYNSQNGKLDEKVVEAKRAMITCPAGELSEAE